VLEAGTRASLPA